MTCEVESPGQNRGFMLWPAVEEAWHDSLGRLTMGECPGFGGWERAFFRQCQRANAQQCAQMVEFIKQEANEKAHEILIKAGEEAASLSTPHPTLPCLCHDAPSIPDAAIQKPPRQSYSALDDSAHNLDFLQGQSLALVHV